MAKEISRRQAVKVLGAAAAATAAGSVEALAAGGEGILGKKTTGKMKVILINGSPRRKGNTNRLLEEVAAQLGKNGIDSEIVQIGNGAVRGCIACGQCSEGHCVFGEDICNQVLDKMASADGLVVGSPVYYGIPTGQILSLIQRMAVAGGSRLQGKPVAAVTVCRRGGATSAFQTLQMPFQMLNMLDGLYPTLPYAIKIERCILAILFHDYGKVYEYNYEGETQEAMYLLGHIYISAYKLHDELKKVYADADGKISREADAEISRIVHCVLAHHGQREFGSPVLPCMQEAVIVTYLDNLSAKTDAITGAGNMEKVFALDTHVVK